MTMIVSKQDHSSKILAKLYKGISLPRLPFGGPGRVRSPKSYQNVGSHWMETSLFFSRSEPRQKIHQIQLMVLQMITAKHHWFEFRGFSSQGKPINFQMIEHHHLPLSPLLPKNAAEPHFDARSALPKHGHRTFCWGKALLWNRSEKKPETAKTRESRNRRFVLPGTIVFFKLWNRIPMNNPPQTSKHLKICGPQTIYLKHLVRRYLEVEGLFLFHYRRIWHKTDGAQEGSGQRLFYSLWFSQPIAGPERGSFLLEWFSITIGISC